MTVEVTLLKKYPLFADLTETQLARVAQICEAECFYPDRILFKEGQPGSKIFLLVEGEVEHLFSIGEEGPTRVALSTPGEILGCPGLVPSYTNVATARSLTQIEVLAIDTAGLRALFEHDCRLAVSIQQHIIQSLLDCITDMRLEPVR
jgi:CRP-like cAMP-binding protein